MFYMSEVLRVNSYRVAEPLKAQTLTAAKREASRRQVFYETVLYITDAGGLVTDSLGMRYVDPSRAIAVKRGGNWENLSEFYPGCSDTKKETSNVVIANL